MHKSSCRHITLSWSLHRWTISPNLIMFTSLQLLLVGTLMASLNLASASKNGTLNVLCLLPYTEPPFYPSFSDGPQIRLALEMAKNEINNQSEILPDYRIELLHANSACQYSSKAYEALLRNVYSQLATNNIVGLIGPGCSLTSEAVGSLISQDTLSLVTLHGGGSLELADRTLYPNALGALGSAEDFAQIVLQLMIRNNWHNVSLLFEETRSFYSSIAQRIVHLVSTHNDLFALPTAVDQTYLPLQRRELQHIRIHFLLTAKDVSQRLLCLARHFGMVYQAYQWIIFVNTFEEIASSFSFVYEGKNYTCTESEMKTVALNRNLFLVYQLSAINDTLPSTYSKHTFKEYDQLIRNGIEEFNFEYSVWTSYFYDSLWAWSVVLDKLTKRLPNMDLSLANYGNTMLTEMILEEFYNLDFDGVSGRIKFDSKSGFVQRPVAVLQVFNDTPQTVAFLKNGEDFIGNVSFIADRFESDNLHVSSVVVGIFLTVALIQLVTLATLNVSMLIYREYPSVKASSLKLNQLIFIGCYLLVLTLILYIVASSHLVERLPVVSITLCNITWSWFLPLSLTLMFGPVAVRTWRLYRIFTHYLNPGRFIADKYLIGFVFGLVVIDLIIGTLLALYNQQRLQELSFPNNVTGNATFQTLISTCRSDIPWLTAVLLFGYKALLMVAVLVLTLLTRNIQNSSFTTKLLRVLIYLVSTTMVVGFVSYYIYFTTPTNDGTFYSFVLTLESVLTIFIALVCVPPLLPKLKDKYKLISWNVELSR